MNQPIEICKDLPARIIGFEGVDASGKTSIIKYFRDLLDEAGVQYIQTREPGGTPIGEEARRILLDPAHGGMDDRAEALLYTASRAQLVREVIKPALERDQWAVCDRTPYSTLVFQGYARGLDVGELRRLQEWAMDGIWPDRVVLLDCSVETSLRRLQLRGEKADRIEQEERSFHERVRAGYLALAKAEPKRFFVLNAEKSLEQVMQDFYKEFWLPLVSKKTTFADRVVQKAGRFKGGRGNSHPL